MDPVIPPVQDTPEKIQVSAVNLSDNQMIEDLHQAQMLDASVGGILQAKKAGKKLSAEFVRPSYRRLHQQWDQLVIQEGVL